MLGLVVRIVEGGLMVKNMVHIKAATNLNPTLFGTLQTKKGTIRGKQHPTDLAVTF